MTIVSQWGRNEAAAGTVSLHGQRQVRHWKLVAGAWNGLFLEYSIHTLLCDVRHCLITAQQSDCNEAKACRAYTAPSGSDGLNILNRFNIILFLES